MRLLGTHGRIQCRIVGGANLKSKYQLSEHDGTKGVQITEVALKLRNVGSNISIL